MPHDDKHYQKLQRTFKFVFDALCLVAVVLIVGLLLIWLYDKIGGTFLSRPWKIVLLIIFAILAALTRVPEYIHDLRKICSIRSSCSILPMERNKVQTRTAATLIRMTAVLIGHGTSSSHQCSCCGSAVRLITRESFHSQCLVQLRQNILAVPDDLVLNLPIPAYDQVCRIGI